LRVLSEFVRAVRPEKSEHNFRPFVKDIYNACVQQLKAQDIDQEVKECAITSIGIILSTLGDELTAELPAALALLLERLKNEITRLFAVKAISRIATSRLNVDISPILADTIKELASFLRKSNRQLKQTSLQALDDVIRKYGTNKAARDLFPTVLAEVSPLISDADLHLSHLSLQLCVSILKVHPESAGPIVEKILPQAQVLLRSSLLQGLALESLLAVYAELTTINTKQASFDSLLESLTSIVSKKGEALSKQSFSSVAQALAAITLNAPTDKRAQTVERFIKDVSAGKDDQLRLLALLSLGEIGRRTDTNNTSLLNVVTASFESPSEEIKQAASFALGNISVGNLTKYLPFVLNEIKTQPKRQYLLLHSLREIIVREAATGTGASVLSPHLTPILSLLFENCESEEEGTRNVVAECLGKLALICPEQLIPLLKERVSSTSAYSRSTVITALKFTILEQPQPIDALLQPAMPTFLQLLKDTDLNVRRVTLLTLNYAAHNKPALIRDTLPNYLPTLYSESKVKPELIREVDLGPFKHKVDDGLEIRKAAYECMYTLLDTCIDRVELSTFITNLNDGLKDNVDIKLLCHLMLIRLAQYAPVALVEGLPQLIESLRTTVTTKVPEGAVKQQVERNEEMIRSALRAVAAAARIPNVEGVTKFDEFLKQTVLVAPLAEKYAQIVAEESASRANDTD
jgi:cullin-associated NEDD8-dissociated protein 1